MPPHEATTHYSGSDRSTDDRESGHSGRKHSFHWGRLGASLRPYPDSSDDQSGSLPAAHPHFRHFRPVHRNAEAAGQRHSANPRGAIVSSNPGPHSISSICRFLNTTMHQYRLLQRQRRLPGKITDTCSPIMFHRHLPAHSGRLHSHPTTGLPPPENFLQFSNRHRDQRKNSNHQPFTTRDPL